MSYFLLLFEFIFHFGLELFFIFLLKEYYFLQILISIDIIVSSFLYFSIGILYILEVFNLFLCIDVFIKFNFYISILWMYLLFKNYIRHFFFYHFFKKETIVYYEEQNEIDIQI